MRANDGYRQDRDLGFDRNAESPLFEGQQVTIWAAGALREKQNAYAVTETFQRSVDLFPGLLRIFPVDENMAHFLTADSDAWRFSQLLLDDPFEIEIQPAVKRGNVEEAEVIGHHDVGTACVDVLGTFELHPHRG